MSRGIRARGLRQPFIVILVARCYVFVRGDYKHGPDRTRDGEVRAARRVGRVCVPPLDLQPFKAGLLHPLSHPVVTAKAALAAVFVYHELKLAVADARSSKILAALFAPVVTLADKVKALGSSLTGGATDAAAINSVQAGGGQIVQAAGAKGIQIPDIPAATPSG